MKRVGQSIRRRELQATLHGPVMGSCQHQRGWQGAMWILAWVRGILSGTRKCPHRLRTVQRPTGTFDSEICHVFHWPPETGQPSYTDTFNPENLSTHFAARLLPEMKGHLVVDVYGGREGVRGVRMVLIIKINPGC